MLSEFENEKRTDEKPRFYPVKNEAFDNFKFLEEHYLEMSYDFDQVNGLPVLIVSKKQ